MGEEAGIDSFLGIEYKIFFPHLKKIFLVGREDIFSSDFLVCF